MFELDKLYNSSDINELCKGCSVLKKSKPCHTVLDYEKLGTSDILFLSDSLKYKYGETKPFSSPEYNTIKRAASLPFVCAASVKCPTVKEADMFPADMKICRQHLEATIDKVKPKVVFTCGNLAMKMLIRKSGITSKRGKAFDFTSINGHTCVVVPIFHPYSVIKEPRHSILFQTDINNAIEKYVLGKKSEGNFSYQTLMSLDKVEALFERLKHTDDTVACDIETTGLNFKTDLIQTIAFSTQDGNWVVPCDHKDSPFKGLDHQDKFWMYIRGILVNSKNKKVFHNAKFDLKFLYRYNIIPTNVWDTKIMHHIINENLPKGLMDLVKLYFPTELESL
jgi:hypothetical protein